MKCWIALEAAALEATRALSAAAEPPAPTTPELAPKRAIPDYRGRVRQRNTARDAALWVPRVILAPLYLVTEYGIRVPLSVVIPAAEGAEMPRKVYDFFTFGPEHNAGIVPVAYFDFGLNPSAGFYAFWHDAFASGNDWSLHGEAWPSDWYAASLKETVRLGDRRVLVLHLSGVHRPDQVFYGTGPRTLQSNQVRFTESVADESATLTWKYAGESRLQLVVGLRSESLGPGAYGHDPSLEQEAATGAFAVPNGFGGRYAAEYNRVVASLDSRRPWPAPGSGARIEAQVEEGTILLASAPTSDWIRYGAAASGFLDFDQHSHVVSVSVDAFFADPLGDRPIPFTQLVAVGGDGPMRGYLPRRMLGRSAAVAALHYVWPIAPWVGGNIEVALGNVFDAHLQGFRPGLLRVSGDVGVGTIGVGDYPIEATVGAGSETFEQGGQIDSVRLSVSVNHAF